MIAVLNEYIIFIIPFAAAAFAEPLFEFAQRLWSKIDKLPAVWKRIISPTLAFWINWAGVQLGAWTGTIDPAQMDVAVWTNFLAAALTFMHHSATQAKLTRDGDF